MKPQNNNRILPVLLQLCAVFTLASSAHAVLLFDLDFNSYSNPGTNNRVQSTGAAGGTFELRRSTTAGSAASLLTTTANGVGGGVSGRADDQSFNETAATGMGTGYTGPVAYNVANTMSGVAAQTSVTIAAWFKTDSTTSITSARLFETGNISMNSAASGEITFSVNGANSVLSSAAYGATQEWVFVAATFDGSIASGNNVNFYIGGLDREVSLVSSARMNQSNWAGLPALTSGGGIRIGNVGNNTRPFDGYLDNVQLYGETSGGGGALGRDQLELLRLSQIPEPSTSAALVLGGVGTMLLLRRRGLAGR